MSDATDNNSFHSVSTAINEVQKHIDYILENIYSSFTNRTCVLKLLQGTKI